MIWGKKSAAPPPISEPKSPEQSPDEIISEMISAYQSHFYERAKGPPDPSVEAAKAKLERTNKIISDSRIGYSLCRFVQQLNDGRDLSAAAMNVRVTKDKSPDNERHDRTVIQLVYSGAQYTIVSIDQGIPTWTDDDFNSYCTIELYSGKDLVCAIDASADQSRGFEYARWSFRRASAFVPGEWMRHIVEMAALIDAHNTKIRNQFFDEDVLKRAAKIKL